MGETGIGAQVAGSDENSERVEFAALKGFDGGTMREGFKFGLRTLGKYLVLFLLSLMFLGMISWDQMWLQVLLNAVFLAGFALLTFNEAGAIGERAETLRVTMENRRAEGGKIDLEADAKSYRPAIAVTGFVVAALPLLIIALVNLASLPANPQSLDPANFQQISTPAPEATLLPGESAMPGATIASDVTPMPEATVAPEATLAPEIAEAAGNPYNTAARLAFSPFIALYGLLNNNLMLLYLLMVPLSFFLPAFALAGYLQGPKLRLQKLEAIKKGIRAKKRKERRARKSSGPKPEV
jgi:hypothetical protein